MLTRWRKRSLPGGVASPTGVASPGGVASPPDEPALTRLDDLREAIAELTARNRVQRSLDTEREILRLRHLAGIRLMDTAPANPEFAEPEADSVSDGDGLPELAPEALTPGRLRAGVLHGGAVLVRGLISREQAQSLADGIERGHAERDGLEAGAGSAAGHYEEFVPEERFGGVMWRSWIKEGGGLLAADSPRLAFEMLEAFEQASIPSLVSGYLGEPALISVHKTTLRRADPDVSGAWHQDGQFMGPVRSLNLWLSLSRCGDVAPGLDLVPRRLENYLDVGTEGAELDWTISDAKARDAAGSAGVLRPVFEPGDAVFFDELFLHKTGSSPEMPNSRYAIENWFFGGSAFPEDYAPLAV